MELEPPLWLLGRPYRIFVMRSAFLSLAASALAMLSGPCCRRNLNAAECLFMNLTTCFRARAIRKHVAEAIAAVSKNNVR